MKRLTVRLTILSVAGVLGLIAIAQARYGRNASSEPQESVADRAADPPRQDDDASAPTPLAPRQRAAASMPVPIPRASTDGGSSEASAAAQRASFETAGDQSAGQRYGQARPGQLAADDRQIPDAREVLPDDRRAPRLGDLPPTEAAAAVGDRYRYGGQVPGSGDAAVPRPNARQQDTDLPVQQAPPVRTHDQGTRRDPFAATVPVPLQAAADDDSTRLQPRSTPGGEQLRDPSPLAASSPYGTLPNAPDGLAGGASADLRGRGLTDQTVPRSEPDTAGEGTGVPGTADLEGTQAPSLTLQKFAPAEIQVGKECTFEIKIRNTGTVAAHGVTVLDEVPQKTRLVVAHPPATESADGRLVWELGTLSAGQEASIEMQLMPTAEGEVGSVAQVHLEAQASVRTVATKPELALRLTGPRQVMIGDEVPIHIEISNPGSGAASGVILLEDVPTGMKHPAGKKLEFELGTLAPEESRQLDLVLTAEQAGTITNRLTARGDANLSVQADVDVEVIAPQLKVAIDGPKKRYLERQATYVLSVDNPGTATAKDIELAAHLPKGMKFVSANNLGHYDAATHVVAWGLEELPAKERGSVELITIPIEPGSQTLRAKGKAAQGLADEVKQDVDVEGVAAIMFGVTDLEDPIEVGGETTYEIHVVNQGSKAATQVQVAALIPPDMKPLKASGPTPHRIEADGVVFEKLRQLAPKADTTFRLTVQGLAAGDQRLSVQVVTDEIKTPVTKEESTKVYADE